MEMQKKIYCIRASIMYAGIVFMFLLVVLAYYRNDLYELWKKQRGMEIIIFEGMRSELENQNFCYLCGNSSRSLIGYYRKEHSVGIISLSNWYVTDFRIKKSEDEGDSGISSTLTNIDGTSIHSESVPNRGMGSIEVNLSEDCQVNYEMLIKNLCQSCLDKILSSLEYSKWKVEDKRPIPLCLVDFDTLDIYSLQNTSYKYSVRDYWIVVSHKDNVVNIDLYDLPYKN